MAATYYVDLINTADSYNYRCVYQPLGCDSLRFQMNFSLESFPLYVGGGISVGTLKFIKADANELRTIFNTNALYNLSIRITNIASGLAWPFRADWSNYTDDGNFVEIGLIITNLRDKIKAFNISELDLSSFRQFVPITDKPQISNKLLWQRQPAGYTTDSHTNTTTIGLMDGRSFFDQIKDGGTLNIFKFAENMGAGVYGESVVLLDYQVPDGVLHADTSVGINITGQLVFIWDKDASPNPNPHDFCVDPQIRVRIESKLIGASSSEFVYYETSKYIVYPPDTTTTVNINWTGVVPVYRSAPKASGYSEIRHVVTVYVGAYCSSIIQYDTAPYFVNGYLQAVHNIILLSQNLGVVSMPDLITAVNSAVSIFDGNETNYFLDNYLLTTQFFSAGGTNGITAKLEEILSAWSHLSGNVLVEKNGLVTTRNWDTTIADMKDNSHTITHFYDFQTIARNDLRTGVALPQKDEISDLNFYVQNYWNNQRYALNNAHLVTKKDIALQHNYIVDGQQVFINLLKNEPTNKDIMMLWQDGTDVVDNPLIYPNEYFSARRIIGRLSSYIYSRMPTTDNINPEPTPTPQYTSQIPSDNGTPVTNDSALVNPIYYLFKPYKVKCKMLISATIINDIIKNSVFSFYIDGKYYYPTSMALGLESDTYEVEMLEFA
ncbi:MAG: hypothetical protein II027_03160 [Bacteroidales bacterium]|nr:hypothetical protein [Bacteroidales bacterium]